MAKGTFGERLKRERELREVTREEVAAATRISERFLTALENEDWNRLPGGIFGRGFVRSIARYLGLNEENLLAEYDLARRDQSASASPRLEERIPSPPKWVPVAVVLAVLLLLAGLVAAGIYGWRKLATRHALNHSSFAPAGGPSPALSSPASSPAAPVSNDSSDDSRPLDLAVSATVPVRVRILADGRLVFDAEFPGGETRHFAAQNRFEISASDSSDVLLELNGQAMPPLGEPGGSGTIVLSRKDLRQAPSGNSQP